MSDQVWTVIWPKLWQASNGPDLTWAVNWAQNIAAI